MATATINEMSNLAILQRLGNGDWLDDVADALKLLYTEVIEAKKVGTLSLTLKVSPGPGDLVVVVDDEIARKPPKKAPRSALYFSYGGEAYAGDPRQTRMDLREVPGGTELRVPDDVHTTTREA